MNLPETMRAFLAPPKGEDRAPVLTHVPVPKPGPREVLLKVKATALNRADLLQCMGLYPPPPGAPAVLGLECAGVVAAAGEAVTRWKTGDELVALVAGGGYGEYCAADEGSCLEKPAALDWNEAGATAEAVFTVWSNVAMRASLKPGETLLVHGGASGIGTTAIQIFAALGHRVFATAGGEAKTALCRQLGAARAIDYKTEDFAEIVRAETGGKGVDVILDMVGADYIERNLKALAVEGRVVNIAYQNGSTANVNFMPVMLKRLSILGSTLRARSAEDKAAIVSAAEKGVWPLLARGTVKPVIDRVFGFEDAGAAHARMSAGVHAGKIVLSLQ
jgi:NADPH2:quinone reductase